jgi:hypothetical protein
VPLEAGAPPPPQSFDASYAPDEERRLITYWIISIYCRYCCHITDIAWVRDRKNSYANLPGSIFPHTEIR